VYERGHFRLAARKELPVLAGVWAPGATVGSRSSILMKLDPVVPPVVIESHCTHPRPSMPGVTGFASASDEPAKIVN
jgi:hypothetical protein